MYVGYSKESIDSLVIRIKAIIFKTVIYIFVAPVVAPVVAPHMLRWTRRPKLVVAFVYGQSREFRVCRHVPCRVPNRARVFVFCTLRCMKAREI